MLSTWIGKPVFTTWNTPVNYFSRFGWQPSILIAYHPVGKPAPLPPGILGRVWRHFGCPIMGWRGSKEERRKLSACSGGRPGTVLHLLQYAGRPPVRKMHQVPRSNSARPERLTEMLSPICLSELSVNEDCEAKCIMQAEASCQGSPSSEGALPASVDHDWVSLCVSLQPSGVHTTSPRPVSPWNWSGKVVPTVYFNLLFFWSIEHFRF